MKQTGLGGVPVLGKNVDAVVRRDELLAVGLGIIKLVQQANIVAPLFAPRSEQRVSVLVELLRIGYRQPGVGLAPPALGVQQVAVADDIGPVELARVVNAQHDLAEAAEYVERLQGLTGQG